MRKIVRVPGTNVLRRLRGCDAITSCSIECPDCSKSYAIIGVDDFPKTSETTESNATLQTVSAF